MPTITTTASCTRNGSQLASAAVATTFDTIAVEFDSHADLTASTTNLDVPVSIDYTKIRYVYLYSDVNVTIKTNSTGSPDQTLTLTAGHPVEWSVGDMRACPFTANLTHLYLTTTTAATDVLLLIGVNS